MAKLRGGARFTQKSFTLNFVQKLFPRHLDGADTIQFRIAGLPDAAKRTLPQDFKKLKVSNGSRHPSGASRCMTTDQTEVAAAGRTVDLDQGIVFNRFDRMVAVWTTNSHLYSPI